MTRLGRPLTRGDLAGFNPQPDPPRPDPFSPGDLAALKAHEGRKQVKSIVVYVLVGDSFATLSDGVLSVGGHAVMDGLGSFLHEEQVAKALGAKR